MAEDSTATLSVAAVGKQGPKMKEGIPIQDLWAEWVLVGDARIEHCKKGNLSSLYYDEGLPAVPGMGVGKLFANRPPPTDAHLFDIQEVARLQAHTQPQYLCKRISNRL